MSIKSTQYRINIIIFTSKVAKLESKLYVLTS